MLFEKKCVTDGKTFIQQYLFRINVSYSVAPKEFSETYEGN